MAIKHKKAGSKRRFPKRNAVKGGTTRLINPRMTLISEDAAAANGQWTMETKSLHLPSALIEASGARHDESAAGRFMLMIVGIAVIFISIISWLVSEMPEK